jgi:hypothetical protein
MGEKGSRPNVASGKTMRQGWSVAFQQAAETPPDALLLPDHLSDEWDGEEWTW